MRTVIRISGKARQVFILLALLAKQNPNLTIGEIIKQKGNNDENYRHINTKAI